MSDDAIFNANNPFLPLPPESFHSYSSSIHPTPDSSTVLDKLESEVMPMPMPMPMNHKRKTRDGSSLLTYAHSQRKYNNGRKEGGLKKLKTEKKCYQKVPDEAPAPGYIHVRARRGQATDTHSLAERIRREKISERMKILQTLVPGCDKVTGKALMLDEIINYVQSLQNQVEFLSMKLASANPVLYNFGMDLDIYAGGPQVMSGMCMDMVSQAQLPNYMPISNTIQPTASAAAPTILTAGNSSFIPQLDNSSSLLLEQEQLLQHEIQNTSLLNLDGVSLGMLLDSEEERQNLQNSTGSISITNNSYFFP